jgi:hypothetical protein
MIQWSGTRGGSGDDSSQNKPPRTVYGAFNNTDDGTPPSAIADARFLADALRNLGYT